MRLRIGPNPAIDAPRPGPGNLGRFRHRAALGHQQNRLDPTVRAGIGRLLQSPGKTTFIIAVKTTF